MDMKFLQKRNLKIQYNKIVCRHNYILNSFTKEEKNMLKLLAKVAEKYARATNTASLILGFIHQPKMPASLIKKD